MTLADSRISNGAEKSYAVIQRESIAIDWSLEQTWCFTKGCKNIIVVTDHKPLVKIFGDRALNEIQNTQIFRLKQRTLPWIFEVQYMPGKTNLATNAASHYPTLSSVIDSHDGDLTNNHFLLLH